MGKTIVLSGLGSAKTHVFNEIKAANPEEFNYVKNGFQVIQQAINADMKSLTTDDIKNYLEMVANYYITQESRAQKSDKMTLQDGSLLDVTALGYGLVDRNLLETLANIMLYKHKYYRVINLPMDDFAVSLQGIDFNHAVRVNERIAQLVDYFNIPAIDFLSEEVRHQVAYVLTSLTAVPKDRDITQEQDE